MEGHSDQRPTKPRKSADDDVTLLQLNTRRQPAGLVQELFHEDVQGSESNTQPWWKIQLFVWEPVLFGTWDGVFTTCMINIFGVVLFLRTGWLVGNTGILLGMFLVSLVVVVALVTVVSGIGVCERCSIGNGGVYSMISTVLGERVGATIGLLYIFGQCVAGAMYITGFAESIADLLSLRNIWAVRGISIGVLLGLLGINLAGVKWIIRLQLLLLALLAISTLDFVVGTFTHLDTEHGFVGYSEELLRNNTLPDYTPGETFFTVFGVFFPAATGVMAGFNMSGDLRKPASSIPLGSLAAVSISWFLYLVFVFLLGAICTREALRYDFMIAEKVSLVGFLFLLGLYISSLASCMGGLYGAPRILQCIAQEKVIPTLGFLGNGRGPNKTPVAAICLTSLITMAFIFIGQVNILAPIVTINFMLTYSVIDYSYFSVSMSYILQKKQRTTLLAEESPKRNSCKAFSPQKCQSYGTVRALNGHQEGTLLEFTKDMDQIFQPLSLEPQKDATDDRLLNQRDKILKPQNAAKQMLLDSFKLDKNSSKSNTPVDPLGRGDKRTYGLDLDKTLQTPEETDHEWENSLKLLSSSEAEPELGNCSATVDLRRPSSTEAGDSERQKVPETEIHQMPSSFYSRLCNHWVSFIGALSSLMIMFVIQWIYALANICVAILLYFYIGQVSPGLPPGAAANFSFLKWIQSSFQFLSRRGPAPREQIVVTPSFTSVGMETKQLTEENADFASRDRYHHSSVFSQEELNHRLK
ncbi:solute carrier family 12 member 8 isoform X1 [Erpetoichthys calabaricus]|uniref:solute carrier family 12 member 8 isoform X1 n=1 Tax=Erpetoichthys calabaricus TaxID=27687 RepID=UPI0022344BBB|nr:solute carrier family 12 member 8 isoform X1 [Erpetoichthys calabaricus]